MTPRNDNSFAIEDARAALEELAESQGPKPIVYNYDWLVAEIKRDPTRAAELKRIGLYVADEGEYVRRSRIHAVGLMRLSSKVHHISRAS